MKLSVVSYLDPETSLRVRELQQTLSDITGSKASLTSWAPHVTVGNGVEVNDEGLLELQTSLEELAIGMKPFQLQLEGIGTMDDWQGGSGEEVTPYVIYLNVSVSDHLKALVADVAEACSDFDVWYNMPNPYLPHCTLAFRDLNKEGFEKGLAYLANQQPSFVATVDHVALVEKLPHNDVELIRYEFIG